MGYRRQRPVFRLHFTDPELNGLVVEIRSTSLAELLDASSAVEQLEAMTAVDPDDAAGLVAATRAVSEASAAALKPFVDALVSWNLEDEHGTPTPMTVEGLMSQDPPLVKLLVETWRDTQMAVSAPLPGPSANGQDSPGVPMPMVPLSKSPGS